MLNSLSLYLELGKLTKLLCHLPPILDHHHRTLRMKRRVKTSNISVSPLRSLCVRILTSTEGVPDDEMANAVHPDVPDDNTAVTSGADATSKKKQHGRRILAAIKGVTKTTVETALGTDRLKAAAGAEHAQNRLGVLKSGNVVTAGPADFPCRYKGKKGHAYITNTDVSPALSWTTEQEDIDPVFSIAIADIQEIKKVGGLGWKTRLVVGWATSREIADGLLIIDKQGNEKHLTAMALREELFNRLITMGKQMWETW